MSVTNQQKVFLDTNLWVYLYSGNEPIKEAKINALVTQKFPNIVMSAQVLGEIYNVLSRKKLKPIDEIQLIIREQSNSFEIVSVTKEIVLKAFEIINKYKFSYWDSLIISAALLAGCEILYSEDMHDEQIIESSLNVINPVL